MKKIISLDKEDIVFSKMGENFAINCEDNFVITFTRDALKELMDNFSGILEDESVQKICYSCRFFKHYRAEAGICSIAEYSPGKINPIIDMWDAKCEKWESPNDIINLADMFRNCNAGK